MALRKRMKISLAAAAGLLLAGAAVLVVLTLTSTHQSATEASLATVRFSSAQETRLQQALTASSITDQSRVLAAEIRPQFIAKGQPLLPAGSQLHIEAATFDARSPMTATVDATVTGPAAGHWQLLLISQDGNWQLIGTRRLP